MSGRTYDENTVRHILETYRETGSKRKTAHTLGLDRNAVSRVIDQQAANIVDKGATGIPDPKPGVDPEAVKTVRRFVITSALNNTEIDTAFFKSIMTYCKVRQAQFLVIPVPYKNVSLFHGPYEPWWPSELDAFYMPGDIPLSSHLHILGSMRIQATAARPLQGTAGLAGGKSHILGHPRIALETIATPVNEYPAIHMTTGSISEPSYSETKLGRLGEFHHSKAALVIETDGKYFWWRYIRRNQDGHFIDLDKLYTPEGVKDVPSALALILGDIHVGFQDPYVERATLRDLLPKIGPRNVVLHDVFDGFSASHHHANNNALRVLKAARGLNDVYRELLQVARWLTSLPEGPVYYIIESNHHDHLFRWLNVNSAQVDDHNLWLWHKLNADLLKASLELAGCDGKWDIPSPFELAMRELLANQTIMDNLCFASSKEPLEFAGIDCSQHGHQGPNGSRGSARGFANVQRKTFIGHGHGPKIFDGCYQVGMSCREDMPYISGYSNHLHCHGIINADGTRTLIPVINGKAYLED